MLQDEIRELCKKAYIALLATNVHYSLKAELNALTSARYGAQTTNN